MREGRGAGGGGSGDRQGVSSWGGAGLAAATPSATAATPAGEQEHSLKDGEPQTRPSPDWRFLNSPEPPERDQQAEYR